MLGYTRQEIEEKFNNSFWEMIDPRDRQCALAEALRQTALGPDKELEYRIEHARMGAPYGILDKGHLIRDEEDREYFCCVACGCDTEQEDRGESADLFGETSDYNGPDHRYSL